MISRFGIALAFCFTLALASSTNAQVVRFETTAGEFDMVLNPTNNPLLQDHVDNMLDYVENERYRASWINRADTGFVLQMGGFYSHTRRPPPTMDSIRGVRTNDPVIGLPASVAGGGLSNTVGTVSLALSGNSQGTDQDSGTSSFFVNLTSNTFLDADFTVFAAIPDMTVVNQIMGLQSLDRTNDPVFGADAGDLTFSDVPIQADGFQVFIKRAFVIEDAMSVAKAMAGVQPLVQQSIQAFGGGSDGSGIAQLGSGSVVPEPTSAVLLLAGLAGLACRRSRRANS